MISVLGIHAGVIELAEVNTIHEVLKVLLIHIRKLIVPEGVVVRIKAENRNDLILSEAEQGIKLDDRMLVIRYSSSLSLLNNRLLPTQRWNFRIIIFIPYKRKRRFICRLL